MIKRRFYKLEHGDKDSGSDSSCFSSDSDRDSVESEESESEDAVAEVSDDDGSGSELEGEAPASDEDADDGDDESDGGRFDVIKRKPDFEEPPEEEEENYILGCMIKCKSVYRCRYCPNTICLNEATMQAHVSSKKHSRAERLSKGDDEQVDNPQEKEIKGNRRSRRQGKRSLKGEKLGTDDKQTPSQEKEIKENRRTRREAKRSQKPEKGSSATQGKSGDAMQKSRKKRRQTKDV